MRFERDALLLLLLGVTVSVVCQWRLERRLNTIIERST